MATHYAQCPDCNSQMWTLKGAPQGVVGYDDLATPTVFAPHCQNCNLAFRTKAELAKVKVFIEFSPQDFSAYWNAVRGRMANASKIQIENVFDPIGPTKWVTYGKLLSGFLPPSLLETTEFK